MFLFYLKGKIFNVFGLTHKLQLKSLWSVRKYYKEMNTFVQKDTKKDSRNVSWADQKLQ